MTAPSGAGNSSKSAGSKAKNRLKWLPFVSSTPHSTWRSFMSLLREKAGEGGPLLQSPADL